MQPGILLRILASSVLLILSFPRPDVGILSLVALVPLFMGLSDTGKGQAFFAGWGAGTAWFFFSYNWVSHSLTGFGNIPLPLAQGVILLLAGIHGLYVGLFSILIPLVAGNRHSIGVSEYRGVGVRAVQSPSTVALRAMADKKSKVQRKSVGGAQNSDGMEVTGYGGNGVKAKRFNPLHPYSLTPILVLPSAWVLLEVARSWFPAPFPWLLMGTATWKLPFVGSLYELAGVHGVSFWILLVNVLIWTMFRVQKEERRRAGMILSVVLLLPVILYPIQIQKSGQMVRVGVVQGNFQQKLKWEEDLREETLNTYLSLTEKAVKKGAQLVVWPETAVPSFYQAEPELMERLARLTSELDIHLIFGSPGYEIAGREILLYNRVYHLSPGGDEEFYDKIMLVPFGEYVPLAGLLPFVDKMVPGEGEFSRGAWEGPFKTPVPSGVLICYEISIPSLSRQEVRDGSLMLINVTNDAWFGRSWGPYQHLAVSAVRAMENRVPVLRAANTGISAIIDRRGRIVTSIPLEERGVVVADIETGAGQTVYTRYGDWIVILCMAVISVYFLILLYSWRLRRWTI
jgi:apolipoprotein N-acyltransferase